MKGANALLKRFCFLGVEVEIQMVRAHCNPLIGRGVLAGSC